MIFNIYRTNNFVFSEKRPPCDKAFIKEKDWFVELNTLEDLLNLKEEIGEDVIISDYPFRCNNIGVEHSIEIYDDYRE